MIQLRLLPVLAPIVALCAACGIAPDAAHSAFGQYRHAAPANDEPATAATMRADAATGPATRAAPPEERPGETQGLSVTHHEMRLKGKSIDYTATAGLLQTTGADGKPEAQIFFVAYALDRADAARRPITFVFNGGPGASSMYLHMGAMGPKRAVLGEQGLKAPRQLELTVNDDCWLDASDLVFVDPVGTGYSRPAPGGKPKDFYSLQSDVESLGEFIRLYVTQNERWLSPKYLTGESYGATRAVALSGYLQKRFGMYIDGLVLISSPLNFQLFHFDAGNDLPCSLFLPTYTASAFFHKKLPPELQQDLSATLHQAEQYALNEYAQALAQGDALPDAQRKQVLSRLAQLTGLDEATLDEADLRPSNTDFARQLLKSDRKMLGMYDSRVSGPQADVQAAGEDPSLALVIGSFAATIQQYIRQELRYQTNWPYVFLSGEINRLWNWDEGQRGYVNVSSTLQQAMIVNPNLRVFMAAGRYDMVTGYFTQRYCADHIGLPQGLRPHLHMHVYDSGHQLYTDPASRAKLHEDVAEFMKP